MNLELPAFCRSPRLRWLAIAVGIAAAASSASHARELGSLKFEPCTLESPMAGATTEAQCTSLKVPENHAEPDGRQIELALAWIPVDDAEPLEPVFMIAGGPGQSARDTYPQTEGAFRDVARRHDIFLLDQRGTGASTPLDCKGDEDDQEDDGLDADDPQKIRAAVQRCVDGLKDIDPRYFTTTDAIQDLDDVRQAIGAERISLVGVSYGTRVAQQYLGRYPQHTASVVLDSPVPNALILGSEHARNLDQALDLQFARCRETPACLQRFGDPAEHLQQLMTHLREAPQPAHWRDPISGEAEQGDLKYDDLSGLVRMYAYIPAASSMLPAVLSEAAAGRTDILRAQASLLRRQMEGQFSRGMELSVVCTEDAPMLEPNPDDDQTLLGGRFIVTERTACSVWPHLSTPENFHAPLHSDRPVLVLSGELDPVTPPRYGKQIVDELQNARQLVLKGQGHNVFGAGCMPRLMAQFLDGTAPDKLDASCLDSLPPMQPFAGFYGWEP